MYSRMILDHKVPTNWSDVWKTDLTGSDDGGLVRRRPREIAMLGFKRLNLLKCGGSSGSSCLIEMALAESGEFIFTCSLDSTHWSEMKQFNKDFKNFRPNGVKNMQTMV